MANLIDYAKYAPTWKSNKKIRIISQNSFLFGVNFLSGKGIDQIASKFSNTILG